MSKVKTFFKSFTAFEYLLWGGSVLAIVLSFVLCGNKSYLNLVGSLIGVTALIFIAKGNVIGNCLIVGFAVLYGVISYLSAYYGEMITYLGMSAPASIAAIVMWLRHPFQGKKTQVEVNRLSAKEYVLSFLVSCLLTIAFYFILDALGTANIVWSTVSVLTSLYASYLNIRRSPAYAFAYCINDIVLIVLWALLSVDDNSFICMAVCFAAFLANDLYGFINWLKMRRKQHQTKTEE